MCCCFVFGQGFADEYGERKSEEFADTVVFQPCVTRLEERFMCRIVLGDLEDSLSGAERRDGRSGANCRFILLQINRVSFAMVLQESLLIDDLAPQPR